MFMIRKAINEIIYWRLLKDVIMLNSEAGLYHNKIMFLPTFYNTYLQIVHMQIHVQPNNKEYTYCGFWDKRFALYSSIVL